MTLWGSRYQVNVYCINKPVGGHSRTEVRVPSATSSVHVPIEFCGRVYDMGTRAEGKPWWLRAWYV